MPRFYTGIGSRKTPIIIKEVMRSIALLLEQAGYVLRSGGADGADAAFEVDIKSPQSKNIYLPWPGFNNHPSPLNQVCDQALEMASCIHPNWAACSPGARKLHGRNCYQVLGQSLDTPSDFVICWTPDAKPTGGSRTAIVLAQQVGVPVYNLASQRGQNDLYHLVEKVFGGKQ